ncbi:MAG TPA: hypothetical protein VFV38_46920 [Ktedonobacteraceae bacterium]|nr:hypothetical protein [Ktedonobacteraceae bacterium]
MHDRALSAQEQFFAEINALPFYTEEDQLHLASLACQGDKQARQKLVESLMRNVLKYAYGLAARFPHLTLLEIVQIGNMILVEFVDRSLWANNPRAYLLKTVKHGMYHQCVRSASPISTPRNETPHTFLSLDQPVEWDSETALVDLLAVPVAAPSSEEKELLLSGALAQLSMDRRELLARWFGIAGYPVPESLYDLAHELLPDLPVERAYNNLQTRVNGALLALQTILASAYLTEEKQVPEAYYTASEIRERFGIKAAQLAYWVSKGRLTRYPAPEGVRSQWCPYVYAQAEIEALVEKWQPRAGAYRQYTPRRRASRQSAAPDPLTRQTPDAGPLTPAHVAKTPRRRRRTSVAREEVA